MTVIPCTIEVRIVPEDQRYGRVAFNTIVTSEEKLQEVIDNLVKYTSE